MRLSQCTHGKIVWNRDKTEVGMIVGITNNIPSADVSNRRIIDRAIPLVQWSCEREPVGVHQSNLEPYKD